MCDRSGSLWFGSGVPRSRLAGECALGAESAAERRHVALTHQIFAPRDSPELRRLLATLDEWLKRNPRLSDVRWLRKQDWFAENTSNAADRPMACD